MAVALATAVVVVQVGLTRVPPVIATEGMVPVSMAVAPFFVVMVDG